MPRIWLRPRYWLRSQTRPSREYPAFTAVYSTPYLRYAATAVRSSRSSGSGYCQDTVRLPGFCRCDYDSGVYPIFARSLYPVHRPIPGLRQFSPGSDANTPRITFRWANKGMFSEVSRGEESRNANYPTLPSTSFTANATPRVGQSRGPASYSDTSTRSTVAIRVVLSPDCTSTSTVQC